MKTALLLLAFVLCIFTAHAQAPTAKFDNLRVFLDCQTYCDSDFIKRELNFVDYVNDRFEANVYVLITSQSTGSGGREYKLQFEGQGKFEGIVDTKSYIRQATATDDEDRKEAIEKIKLGLLPYLLKTDKAKDLLISFKSEEQKNDIATAPTDDPWNFWVFNLNVRGYFSGDKNYSNNSLSGNISANRVTDKMKTSLSVNASENNNRFGQGDEEFKYTNRSYSFNNTTVWSVTDRLSAGGYISAQNSDYNNYQLNLAVTPAIEYNFFPYSESNNKYVGLMYKVGPRYFNYKEETIFSEMEELRFQQSLSLDVSLNQKWGQLSGSTSYSHYFHDFDKKRVSFSGYADIRLVKGLSFNVGGYYAIQHDQLNIIKGTVSDEDLLTRRRQLNSNYDFYFNFGIRYRFGSIFNNVVNPRFNGGGGMMYFY
ncbi:hypothetical protein ABID22_003018 [Pontibacter aydingkolensis]|uniref:DUF481 domain-containing protein n=1 Tax=Pontibacter aydingkolensis TaxID=1911536 RepID=A0ABS7CVG0_9BACT|nr:hypothetical protein [Pontibacter aydingkolensis]MBW7467472.1 hypothetical protein [Pontibacter aydingkolensis]